jgi:hypothetical protein
VCDVKDICDVFGEFCSFAFEFNDVLHLLNEKHRNYNYKGQTLVGAARGGLGLNYIGYNKSFQWSSPFPPDSPSTG